MRRALINVLLDVLLWMYDLIDDESFFGLCPKCGGRHVYSDDQGHQLFDCKIFNSILQRRTLRKAVGISKDAL